MPSDYAIHSDLLVHWTGKDIEKKCGTRKWHRGQSPSKTQTAQLKKLYLKRLTDILKYGLWMTNQSSPQFARKYRRNRAPCTCFTELKLSQSHTHAAKFGRLGLGFKRLFVFNRGGRPVIYYGTGDQIKNDDPFSQSCDTDLKDKRFMHFFKRMNSVYNRLNYDLYSESEWRIVFEKEVSGHYRVINPANNDYYKELTAKQRKTLRYLIPVDGWLALIIYPTIAIKRAARESKEIRGLLRKIKKRKDDDGNRREPGNFPVEMDLDLCRNF